MKVAQLLAEQVAHDDMLVVKLLKKLLAQRQRVKVLLRNVLQHNKGKTGLARWTKLPDREWDVREVQEIPSASGTLIRIVYSSPTSWFELQDEDEDTVVLKNMGDYWLLTTKDGQGISL